MGFFKQLTVGVCSVVIGSWAFRTIEGILIRNSNTNRSKRFDAIIFDTLTDAEDCVSTLRGIMSKYEVVTVCDVLDCACIDATFEDTRFGWRSLESMRVRCHRYGYELILPTYKRLH